MILPPVVKLLEPLSPVVTFQVVVPLQGLSPADTDVALVLGQAMATQTDDYTAGRVRMIVAGSGDDLHATVSTDSLRISFSVPTVDINLGYSLLASVIQHPDLSDDAVKGALAVLKPRAATPFQLILDPRVHDLSAVKARDVQRLYAILMRPERMTIGIGGPVTPADVDEAVKTRLKDWTAPRVPSSYADHSRDRLAATTGTPFSLLGLSGPSFNGNDPGLPAKFLAAFALGCGKGASVFKIWRESLHLSYLQTCCIVGSPEGFRLNAWFARESPDGLSEHLEVARKALSASLDGWTEADRARAIAMAESVLLRGLDLSPFAFQPYGPLSNSVQDRTFLAAYWRSKTGTDWDPRALLERFKSVPLTDLKAAAAEFLTRAEPNILHP